MSEEQPSAPPEPAASQDTAASLPDDANDLRGLHFKLLLGKALTWILIGFFVLAGGVAGAVFIGPLIGGIAAVGIFLVAILIVFGIADSRAEDSFFQAYAIQRGMTLTGRGPLPAATPLLRKGDDRYAERALAGDLAPGLSGILALYTYEEETTDSKGNSQTSYYHYTVGLVQVPECASLIPELYIQRKSGLRALEKFEDVFRGSKERVKLESEGLDKKYEIFVDEKQDQNWLRQLFSPTFIVWLLQETPDKFAFELVNGTLCCYASNHKKKAADLDHVCAATAAVATRLREESVE
jgi:hypothetical protein